MKEDLCTANSQNSNIYFNKEIKSGELFYVNCLLYGIRNAKQSNSRAGVHSGIGTFIWRNKIGRKLNGRILYNFKMIKNVHFLPKKNGKFLLRSYDYALHTGKNGL